MKAGGDLRHEATKRVELQFLSSDLCVKGVQPMKAEGDLKRETNKRLTDDATIYLKVVECSLLQFQALIDKNLINLINSN